MKNKQTLSKDGNVRVPYFLILPVKEGYILSGFRALDTGYGNFMGGYSLNGKTLDCESRVDGFDSHWPPQIKKVRRNDEPEWLKD